ncbi:hypothetical protein B0H67DRAFT_42451 [Lasiosphaeris hirsuta]|uniref:BHLH domain-containing protein n=1 Tax=Lasiosphaeris hirsuta TaxID=260670 RepID=A0AA40BAL8_9PEZI|nr:hypothetical protein B0H67DRAFT_42451 [Lasiosphaeris hirsuta]
MGSEPNSLSPSCEDTMGDGEDKPRLTEEEKKQNHIASEKKRRQAIRNGFDRLTELIPGLEGQARSEGVVLRKTVEYIKSELEERNRLLKECDQRGIEVGDKHRILPS